MHRFTIRISALLLAIAGPAVAAPVGDLYVHPAGGAGAGTTASLFEMADEFVVPIGQTWRITGVVSDGFYSPGPNYVISFLTNAQGTPGTVVCSRSSAFPIGNFVESIGRVENPEFRLPEACVLSAGTYFFAQRTGPGGSGQVNTTPTIVGNELRIRGIGGGTSVCPSSFVPRSTCLGSAQDLRFTIRGCGGASCEFPLSATAACSGNDLVVTIADGDTTLEVTGVGPGLPRSNLGLGAQVFPGPGLWTDLAVFERGGDTQSQSFGVRNCGPRAGVLVETDGGTSVSESTPDIADTYTLALASSPDAGEVVTVIASANGSTGVVVSPAAVAFTADNWNVPQVVSVRAVDDAVYEPGVQTDVITHQLTTTPGGVFAAVTIPSVVATIIDNDEAVFGNGFEPAPAPR